VARLSPLGSVLHDKGALPSGGAPPVVKRVSEG
jgi:hypothetical protein